MQNAAKAPKTPEQIQSQITALEYQLRKAKNPYPLQKKIKKLYEQKDLINRWNWLAQ